MANRGTWNYRLTEEIMGSINHSDEAPITNRLQDQYAAQFAVVSLRLVTGWIFFYSGITKVLDPEWTASGYLMHAIPEGNPFMGIWSMLAGMPLVDILFQWGLTLVGLGLLLGAFTTWNAFWGSVMMLLIWASSLPLENGFLIDEHIVYIAVLIGLSALHAGSIVGLDRVLKSTRLVKNNVWLQYLID